MFFVRNVILDALLVNTIHIIVIHVTSDIIMKKHKDAFNVFQVVKHAILILIMIALLVGNTYSIIFIQKFLGYVNAQMVF